MSGLEEPNGFIHRPGSDPGLKAQLVFSAKAIAGLHLLDGRQQTIRNILGTRRTDMQIE